MRGCERWWNPLELRRRSAIGFGKDLLGFGLFAMGVVLPIIYIAIDLIAIASNPVVAPFRPIFSAVVKKFCYCLGAQGFEILGDSYKVWGLVPMACNLGLNTAFGAVQCRSWESLLIFVAVDGLSFLGRIWCHSGKGDTNKLGYYLRRYLIFGKSDPPRGIQKPVYRGFELVMEGAGLSIGFATMVFVYIFSDPRVSPYPMLRQLCFPQGHQSFMFLLTMLASDFIQDIVGVVWVAHRVRYDFEPLFGHPFAKQNRPFFFCQASAWWAPGWLVQMGWVFQRLEVGPFKRH